MDGMGRVSSSSYPYFRGVGTVTGDVDCSQPVGALATAPIDLVAKGEDSGMVDVEVRSYDDGAAAMMTSSVAGPVAGKRKRGRPPRGQPKGAPLVKQIKEEEDVCFICFDGGSLVLCDRRGCPKAYHPACIKRDEEFFQSKAKWNCGWHICSTCQKASSYMCYTCTYSLCKGCTWNADYVCVRGNKGFCGTCMRTVFLIEKVGVENRDTVQVDFDDKSSWEYLFKVYWISLKTELSLTVDELIKAKNPFKEAAVNGVTCGELNGYNFVKSAKINNHIPVLNKQSNANLERLDFDKCANLPIHSVSWATKELLEFVAYTRNGDVSVMSPFDVQALILDYVKRNNLRDPLQKSHILCDARLLNLFGKARLGHIEMLKLIEYHFLVEEKKTAVDAVKEEARDAVKSNSFGVQVDDQVAGGASRRRKSRRKAQDSETQIHCNPDDFAAIDVHNINLIYLKRSLMEILLDEADNFPGKVIGSFVRIKISGGDQKFDAYRLVRVVGTTKAVESYKVGSRTTIFMLGILNLDKQEIISIDGISNQEFSEDECRLLRQSIKCGLVKQLTVGEILDKATMLRPVKVNDMLEMEMSKLSHLRDRASEKGHRKLLREYIEKIECLKSPKERQRRLLEAPRVHVDPKMNPNYISDDDIRKMEEKKPGRRGRPRNASRAKTCVQVKHMARGRMLNRIGNKGDVLHPQNHRMVVGNEAAKSGAVAHAGGTSAIPMRGHEASESSADTQKLWHYQDPTGKVQGPFSMMQLRKWSSNGLFPLDLRVWKTYELQSDSILLTDALIGRFVKEPSNPHPHEVHSSSNNNNVGAWESGINLNQSTDTGSADSKNIESSSKCMREKTNSELMSTIFGSDSPSWTASVTVSPVENGPVQVIVNGKRLSPNSKCCETSSPLRSKDDEMAKPSSEIDRVKPNQEASADPDERRDCSEVNSSRSPVRIGDRVVVNCSSSEMNAGASSQKQKIEFSYEQCQTLAQKEDSLKVVVLDSVRSWSSASSLVNMSEWCPAKPNFDDAAPKSSQLLADHVAGTSSGAVHLPTCTKPPLNLDVWQPIVPDGHENEFSLVDESVSDLLAEVEAMESLGGLPSPMSRMQNPDSDCFNPGEEFTHLHDHPSKNDALSSSGDIQFPVHFPVVQSVEHHRTHFPVELPLTDSFDPHKRSGVEAENQRFKGAVASGEEGVPVEHHLGLPAGAAGGFGGGQFPFLGLGNGGHSLRGLPKGQRVCKYYESGYCRKGAFCSYWHPAP